MSTCGILSLLSQRVVIADGGMGSLLQTRGLRPGEAPETWNVSHPEEVVAVHRAYLEAGSDFVLTNTFGANRVKGCADVPATVVAAVRNARAAAAEAGHGFVALDIGPTGKLLAPAGDLPFEDAVSCFAEQVRAGVAAGADLIVVETMGDLYELKAAVLAAKENSSLPVFATATFDANGKLLTGADPAAVVTMLEGLGVDALGLNCGLGPEGAAPIVRELLAAARVPVMVKPNAGLPRLENGKTVYDIAPEKFAELCAPFAEAGVRILGGCCGTTPAHIAALAARVARCATAPRELPPARTRICCGTHAVEISREHPVVVGERINPTGKKLLKRALAEGDLNYVLRQGVEQQDAGADALDVNVGVPGIDEPAVIARVVDGLQSVVDLPLQIDTADIAAMERALRRVNGKALVNSVNGKRETMDAVFPLVKKYGGVVVGLTLDENGIPPTAEGRLAIAERIVAEAEARGIDRSDIVIDTLCMAVSADPAAARVTLEAIRLVREKLGVNVCLGVSNVSFGLPRREALNSTFFALALEAGLTVAIVNPNNAAMADSFRAWRALRGGDASFSDWIAAAEGAVAEKPAAGAPAPRSLRECIGRGLRDDAAAAAAAEIAGGADALSLVDGAIVPALDEIGKRFEAGKAFLPQLLLAAEAAGAAFGEIRKRLAENGAAGETRGTIAIATVKGDIHDIGKNIVRALLENYGFNVIDLGKDVAPETIVKCVLDNKLKMIGLSALMTTTVGAMEETVKLVHEAAPDCKIAVGGAVLTQTHADAMGADFYGKDAMSTVRYALSVFK